jgi:hypothetical protein
MTMSTAPTFVEFLDGDDGLLHERELDIDWDELDASLDAFEARQAPRSPDAERAANRVLGAPAWAFLDLSDADPLWRAHTCVSDETGACATCTAYQAAGGVL